MRRYVPALCLALALGLALAAPAGAIINGVADGNRHPSVGALLNEEMYPEGTWATCSGTLISSTVFLTAAHCDPGVDRVAVTFDSDYRADSRQSNEYWGTFHAHPGYTWNQDDPKDIAVVVFDKPIKGITPAQLPQANSLGNLAADQRFTSVGYGAYEVTNGPGGKTFQYNDVRMVATGTLNSTNPAWLRISMNASKGDGGTCAGDSGGPNFLGAGATETPIVAATTITGDAVCRSTNVVYRLDTASARDFLDDYVAVP